MKKGCRKLVAMRLGYTHVHKDGAGVAAQDGRVSAASPGVPKAGPVWSGAWEGAGERCVAGTSRRRPVWLIPPRHSAQGDEIPPSTPLSRC
jgi:hypothetical protein